MHLWELCKVPLTFVILETDNANRHRRSQGGAVGITDNTKYKTKHKLNPGSVASYHLQPGNGVKQILKTGLINISKQLQNKADFDYVCSMKLPL